MAATPRETAEKIVTGGSGRNGEFVVRAGVATSYALEIGRYVQGDFLLGHQELVLVRDVKRSVTTTRHINALKALPAAYVVVLTDAEYDKMLSLSEYDRVSYAVCKKEGIPFKESERLGGQLNAIADLLFEAVAAGERLDMVEHARLSTAFLMITWQRSVARIIMQAAQAVGDRAAWPKEEA